MAASKPSLVLVPGMCSVGSVVFEPLIQELGDKHGFVDCKPIDLPSVDGMATKASLKPTSLQADIAAIRSAVESQVNAGKDVVLVAHSYGGTPALYAANGLWKSQRPAGAGGVTRAVLLSSSLSLPGLAIAAVRETYKQAHGGIDDGSPKIEVDGDEMYIIPEGFEYAWMTDITDEKYRSSLRPSPLSTVLTPAPEGDVKAWNISYLVTQELDPSMPEGFQQSLVDGAVAAGATVGVKSMKSGHFVQISHAEEVAQWISELINTN